MLTPQLKKITSMLYNKYLGGKPSRSIPFSLELLFFQTKTISPTGTPFGNKSLEMPLVTNSISKIWSMLCSEKLRVKSSIKVDDHEATIWMCWIPSLITYSNNRTNLEVSSIWDRVASRNSPHLIIGCLAASAEAEPDAYFHK